MAAEAAGNRRPSRGRLDLGGAHDALGIIVAVFAVIVLVVLLFTVVIPLIALALELIAPRPPEAPAA